MEDPCLVDSGLQQRIGPLNGGFPWLSWSQCPRCQTFKELYWKVLFVWVQPAQWSITTVLSPVHQGECEQERSKLAQSPSQKGRMTMHHLPINWLRLISLMRSKERKGQKLHGEPRVHWRALSASLPWWAAPWFSKWNDSKQSFTHDVNEDVSSHIGISEECKVIT